MLRQISAVFVGFLLGIFIVVIGHMAASRAYPPPEGLNVNDTVAVLEYIRQMPLIALIFIIGSHAFGAFTAAFFSSWFALTYKYYSGIFVGALLVIATIVNAFSLPHSFWVAAIDIFSTVVAVFIGAGLGVRKSRSGGKQFE